MKKTPNVVRDKEIGNQGELMLMNLLEKVGIKSSKNNDKKTRAFWDIETEHGTKFEVKFDLYSARSGNLAVEYWNPKTAKPSGINLTQADFWIFVLPDQTIWLAKTAQLKSYCEKVKPLKNITCGGDKNSAMYIYQKDLILGSVFVRLDEKNVMEAIKKE